MGIYFSYFHKQALYFVRSIYDDEQKQNENVFYDIFNVGTGQGNSVLELIRTFEKVTGEKLSYEIGPRRQGDVEKVYANVDKANQKLDWHVQYSLEDSLRDSWNWQKKLGDA